LRRGKKRQDKIEFLSTSYNPGAIMNAENPAGSKEVAAGKQPSEGRLACLDAFRGFDILVMIFVNTIAGMAGIPFILRHAKAEMDAFTLTDLVFPGFLFIVGVAVPLSLIKM